jgi:predicted nucleotidyltransferase
MALGLSNVLWQLLTFKIRWGGDVPDVSLGPAPGPEYIYHMIMRPVTSAADTHARLSACASEVLALGVARLALFGSVLRGEASADSDVDILVEFAPGAKSFDRFMDLADLLEQQLGRPVELVTTEALSPIIGPRILAEAKDVLRAA